MRKICLRRWAKSRNPHLPHLPPLRPQFRLPLRLRRPPFSRPIRFPFRRRLRLPLPLLCRHRQRPLQLRPRPANSHACCRHSKPRSRRARHFRGLQKSWRRCSVQCRWRRSLRQATHPRPSRRLRRKNIRSRFRFRRRLRLFSLHLRPRTRAAAIRAALLPYFAR